MIAFILSVLITGLVVGALGRLALPGPDPMSIPATIGIGVAGSFIAGLIVLLVWGQRAAPGVLLSVLCATGLVYLVRRSRGQGISSTRRRAGSNPYRF
ncbi:MAG: GlsB/YeaQ/YmgE family stress response membrane protein [Solirubrobacterales bacterium]|nr:GlsB/YeaQ/YmgE family stress response membrane protein [Solirubrobacterales bacterium]